MDDTERRMMINDFARRIDSGEFLQPHQLEELHQSAVNAWDDASNERGDWNMAIDAADLTKLTQELIERRALDQGLPVPPQATPEPE